MVDTLDAPMKEALKTAREVLPASADIGTGNIAPNDMKIPLASTSTSSSAVRGNNGGAFRRGPK